MQFVFEKDMQNTFCIIWTWTYCMAKMYVYGEYLALSKLNRIKKIKFKLLNQVFTCLDFSWIISA